jgi:pyroglutamyl-peptidase
MKRLLLTGFEPFDGFIENPSAEVAKSLDGCKVGAFEVTGLVLPLDYKNALSILDKKLDARKSEVILCCGQANRESISIERIAVNVLSTKRPDNYGNSPETDIIDDNGPAAYFANIDPLPLVQALLNEGIPAFVSYHAGAYGCNWLIYNVMQRIENGVIDAKATFIHLPPLPSQAIQKDSMSLATMSLDLQLKAMKTIIESLS